MGITARIFRIPRPRVSPHFRPCYNRLSKHNKIVGKGGFPLTGLFLQTFLYLMSLRTGSELSILALLVNKVSGLYGLLALFTGFHLSPLQLSMYIYSVIVLVLVTIMAKHIRTQSPFHCLAIAQLFVLDTFINAAYTIAFAITWFLVLSQHHSDKQGDSKMPGVGGKMMGDTAGFTSPEFNVSSVNVAVAPDQGIPGEKQEAVTSGPPGNPAVPSAPGPSLGHGVLQPESMSSIIVIAVLWAIRMYLVLIVMSYARLVLRRWVMANAGRNTQLFTGSKSAGMLEDPFAIHSPEGKGWRGKLGRMMVGFGRSYWLGAEQGDEGWMHEDIALGGLNRGREGEQRGVGERERRRRSGTVSPPVLIPSAFNA